MELQQKYDKLKEIIRSYGKVCIAFSGGIDSSFLLKTAIDVLGDNVIAVSALINSVSDREMKDIEEFVKDYDVKHLTVKVDELSIPGFAQNPKNRCYICKKVLMGSIIDTACENGYEIVAEGSNISDSSDYRPGAVAIKELGIKSPLVEAGFNKADIREMAKKLGIKIWNKPSFACLSSRIPYGEMITKEKLEMVNKAEQYMFDKGFDQVRVRVHGNLARIEVMPQDMDRVMETSFRADIYEYMKSIGFTYVALDMSGYRTGSMNEGNI